MDAKGCLVGVATLVIIIILTFVLAFSGLDPDTPFGSFVPILLGGVSLALVGGGCYLIEKINDKKIDKLHEKKKDLLDSYRQEGYANERDFDAKIRLLCSRYEVAVQYDVPIKKGSMRKQTFKYCIGIDSGNKNLVFFKTYSPVKYDYDVEGFGTQIYPPVAGRVEFSNKIPIETILYFKEIGSLQYVSKVEDTGPNIGGAIIGGMIAGDAGAIIGGQSSITTKIEEKDGREVLMKLINGAEGRWPYNCYEPFIKLIPNKEYSMVTFNNPNMPR